MSDRRLPGMQFFDKPFSEEQREFIYKFLNLPGWETGWKSNNKRDVYTFLHKHYAGWRKVGDPVYNCVDELQKNAPFIAEAWRGLKEKYFREARLVRCYANGMAYGMDGTVHTDSNDPGNFTFVYYPHERWSPNWGGETIFYNHEENGIIGCSFPRPNSAILFDGRIPHRANGVTRQFPGMRITLMFKIEFENVRAT